MAKDYVARFSDNIQADLERGWSAWMGSRSQDLEDVLEFCGITAEQIENGWERWQDPDWHPWHHRDTTDREEFLLDLAENENHDIRFDAVADAWAAVHHDGLSCFRLEAETEADAIQELANVAAETVSFSSGDMTEGAVRLVHSRDDGWHLLQADGVWIE